jgi:hypothetical protein
MPLIPVAAVSLLKRRAVRKGVMGQSTAWRAVALVAFVGPFVRRRLSKDADTLAIDALKPGESILIRTAPAPTRAERKQARKVRKARKRHRRARS